MGPSSGSKDMIRSRQLKTSRSECQSSEDSPSTKVRAKHTHSMTSSPRRHNNVPSPSPSPGNREIHADEDSKRLRPSAMPVAKKHTTQERKVASIEQHRAIQHRPTIRPGANTTRSPFDGQEYLHSRNRVDHRTYFRPLAGMTEHHLLKDSPAPELPQPATQ